MAAMDDAIRDAIVAARPRTHAALRRWRDGPEMRAIDTAFAGCPLDRAEPAAKRAEQLLGDAGWAEALLAPLVEALAADPFFEPGFKASRDALRTGAVIHDCPAAALTMSVTSAAAMAALPQPATIVFTGRVTVTRTIRSGGAVLRRWHAPPPPGDFTAADAAPCMPLAPLYPRDGEVHRIDGRSQAQLITDAGSDVVTLVAAIRPGALPVLREHNRASGALLRIASADDRASRVEMLLTFLRMAGRADAGARFDAATRDATFHLRWAAMREWLALDAEAALPRLAEMALGDANAEVRAAAGRTLTVVWKRIEATRCLA